jgi:Mrp family chromosome partitioning ATPase/capsular polysaccharide biosynthesis protein
MESIDQQHPQGREAAAPRYTSFSDYIRVVRRRKLLIAAVTVVCAAGAAAFSLTRPEVYVATVQLSFRDVLADLNLLGVGGGLPEQGPAQRAAQNAELLTGPQVARRARRIADGAAGTISTQVGTQTSLVSLQARSPSPEEAADLANAYATAAKQVITAAELRRLERAQDATLDEIQQVQESPVPGVTGIRLSVLEQQLSRLETVEQIAEPVEVIARAAPPREAVSPTPARDTALGAMLGLVAGLLLAFLRESLDRRLHTAHEVHQELGLPVLGRIADTAFGAPGLVSTNGRAPMLPIDFEAFRVLRTNLAHLQRERPIRSLLVTSGLPQEGKTTVSMSLASASVIAGNRTLLVECDLRRPTFAKRLGIAAAPGLTDYVSGMTEPAEVLQTVDIVPPQRVNGAGNPGGQGSVAGSPGKLVCISAGSQYGDGAELLLTARFRDFLEKVTKAYDFVVIDCSPLLAVVDPLELVPLVDGVLVCVRASQTTRDEVHATRSALSRLPDRPMGAVLTGVSRGGPDAYDYYYGY